MQITSEPPQFKETIKILEQYNSWRTDKSDNPTTQMTEPKQITEAIDSAIEHLKLM